MLWRVKHRCMKSKSNLVDARLAQMQIPADDYFIWITGEGKVVKNLSRRFEAEQYDPQRVRAAAYWHAK